MKKGLICFDMDGTIADLFAVPDWEKKLNAGDVTPYAQARPMWDMAALRSILIRLNTQGWEIRVITWLAKNSSEGYKEAVRQAKTAWLKKYHFPASRAHMVAYGATKANCIRKMQTAAILIDDNPKIRSGWTMGRTIDPTDTDIIAELAKLLEG